jgi:hypothetical protein
MARPRELGWSLTPCPRIGVATDREWKKGAARVALLLASDTWGLGDELEMFWVLFGGRREGGKGVRGQHQILSKICFGFHSLASPPNGYCQNGHCSKPGGLPERDRSRCGRCNDQVVLQSSLEGFI